MLAAFRWVTSPVEMHLNEYERVIQTPAGYMRQFLVGIVGR